MQRFFFDNEIIENDTFTVKGEKYNHIIRVIRLSVGEQVIFCDGNFNDYQCELISVDSEKATFKILDSYKNKTEPDVKITIFQCLPKSDKMDDMVKRCVQFGAFEIVPVLSKRCVSRPDNKSFSKKLDRFNKIARSSAMQSMRGYIPKVTELIDFKTAILKLKEYDTSFVCYEGEAEVNINSVDLSNKSIAFLIGPEGGIDETEIEYAINNGIKSISLGKRILRTEDAAAFLIPILLSNTKNL